MNDYGWSIIIIFILFYALLMVEEHLLIDLLGESVSFLKYQIS